MPINVCQKDQIIFCGSGTAVLELVVLMTAVVAVLIINIPFILGQLEVLELLFVIRLTITVLIFLE
jgi:hypothetical protein